ncbi:ImmA/IrrE family metallo-endopeptidase [Halobacillus litoralis]|uniref:IrrE N-terminal-like domain-containing protein n=1 Tax=Halobacillus litoralis TaxID=45668 RepID=A0A410MDN5_9BACI|nr:ImmA/IrrE family metallo-endopeptidase [Halobacillus litoralis]QAS52842.1 hypothetical protein HLI_11865 [Halobacillus litoralis]
MYQYTLLESYIKDLLFSMCVLVPNQLTMERLAKRAKIKLHYIDDSSVVSYYDGQVHIFIDSRLSIEKQWVDFCHEFCHATTHFGDQMRLPKSFVDYQEAKARNFAMHMAVPTFMLIKMKLPFNIVDAAYIVAETFGVPPNFALRRLHHFENQVLSAESYDRFRKSVPTYCNLMNYGTSEEV